MVDALWMVTLAAVGAWALWGAHELLFLCAMLGLLVAGSIVVSRRFGLVGVEYQRALSAARAQFGEIVELSVSMTNRKLLPVASLRIEDELPRHLEIEGGSVRARRGHLPPTLAIVRSMFPYEQATRRFRVRCVRRGRHRFGPASCEIGDYLGTRPQRFTVPESHELLVFPRVFPLAMATAVSDRIVGRQAARRLPFSDPLQRVGARPYAPGDPMRLINWRATARRASIMVHEIEPSSAPTVQIALDFRVQRPRGDRYEPDELELAISVAASLAAHGNERKWRTGLVANGTADAARIDVPPSRSPAQLGAIFDALARASSIPYGSFAELLLGRRRQVYASLIVITTGIDDALAAALSRTWRGGSSVLVVLVAPPDEPGPELGPVPMVRVAYDNHWADRDELVLAA
jgi:uncharacterized protein (DUF58 family)